ncbi:hypothetical protein [uncultured Microbulbifer sp.]|uniref:hypothetical protein n=1 Tax=uncultured Microbulbifer sp. TaxID=348147 RepID=UPI0026205992|nr:hypothetical protein [uncultured Microbulbifer sp.]
MSFWSAVKGIFSSNAKPVDDILDKDRGLLVRAGGFINDLSYTEQERVRDNAELVARQAAAYGELIDTVTEHARNTASENTQRSLTRRQVAIAIIRVELFLVLASVVIWPFQPEYARFVWLVASSSLMIGAFMAVVVFFFGSYGISNHLLKPLREAKKKASG